MGTYRFTLKAEFEMGGVKDKCDMWLNYSPGEMTNIDRTVEEWLNGLFLRGKQSIDNAIWAADVNARAQEKRAEEDRILAEADRIRAARGGLSSE